MALKAFVNCTSNPVVSEAVCAKVAAALGIDAADVVRIPPGFSVCVVDVAPAPEAVTTSIDAMPLKFANESYEQGGEE